MNDNPTTAEEQYELGKKYLGPEYIAGMTIEERKKKAADLFTKAAEQGYAEAQYKLGYYYWYENNELKIPQDQKKSLFLVTKAAEQNHYYAQCRLNWFYRLQEKDTEKASYWDAEATKQLRKSAEQGDTEAMYKLSEHYNHVEDDMRMLWLTKAAERGYAKAQYDLAKAYRLKDKNLIHEQNHWFTEAYKQSIKDAERGDAEAMYRLRDILTRGSPMGVLDIKRDDVEAKDWLFKAAKLNYAPALYAIGHAYQYGWEELGLHFVATKNEEYANNFYTSAATLGHAEAQYYLGNNYINGIGIAKDLEKGNYWLTKAAEQQGNINTYKIVTDAQYKIGINYLKGVGVEKDIDQGIYWLTKAASIHHDAQLELARFYSNDKEKQQYWENKANGSKKSGCYIATCVYGSYDCPEVLTLRQFRDNELSNSWLGRQFIRIYYAISPKIVELFGNKKWFTKFWKPIIDKIVHKLQRMS